MKDLSLKSCIKTWVIQVKNVSKPNALLYRLLGQYNDQVIVFSDVIGITWLTDKPNLSLNCSGDSFHYFYYIDLSKLLNYLLSNLSYIRLFQIA